MKKLIMVAFAATIAATATAAGWNAGQGVANDRATETSLSSSAVPETSMGIVSIPSPWGLRCSPGQCRISRVPSMVCV